MENNQENIAQESKPKKRVEVYWATGDKLCVSIDGKEERLTPVEACKKYPQFTDKIKQFVQESNKKYHGFDEEESAFEDVDIKKLSVGDKVNLTDKPFGDTVKEYTLVKVEADRYGSYYSFKGPDGKVHLFAEAALEDYIPAKIEKFLKKFAKEQQEIPKVAKVAAQWWADELRAFDVDNSWQANMLSMFGLKPKEITEEKIEEFRVQLEKAILSELKIRDSFPLRVDYDSEGLLGEVADRVGIYGLPEKTVMHVGRTEVKVSKGRGAEYETIYPSENQPQPE